MKRLANLKRPNIKETRVGTMEDNKNEEAVSEALVQARQFEFEVSPYMKTRVLAALAERHSKSSSLIFWKRLALLTSGVFLFTLAFNTYWVFQNPTYEAHIGQAFLVRIELKDLKKYQISEARIELPAGVQFYSEMYPELENQTSLVLNLQDTPSATYIPFIVKASEMGTKALQVKFFNQNRESVATRELKIKFKEGDDS